VLGLSEQGFCQQVDREIDERVKEFVTLTQICSNLGIPISEHSVFRGQAGGGPIPRDKQLVVESRQQSAAPRVTDADAEQELSQAERDYCKSQFLSPAKFLEAKKKRGGKASMSVK